MFRLKKYQKPLILLLIAALIFLADRTYGWSAWFSDAGNLQFLQVLVQENLWLALLIYVLLTIVGCVVLALPGVAMFTIGSAGLAADGNRWLYFGAAGLLLLMVFLMGTLVRKRYLKAD